MKVQTVGSISEFLHREQEPFSAKVERHFKKYGFVYNLAVTGVTVLLITNSLGGVAVASTAIPVTAAKSSGIDAGARALYYELVNLGRWIIAFKGGIDVIKSIGSGDIDGAKKTFITHVLAYVILLALPPALDKIDGLFNKTVNA
jgi:hypothetical protein